MWRIVFHGNRYLLDHDWANVFAEATGPDFESTAVNAYAKFVHELNKLGPIGPDSPHRWLMGELEGFYDE